MLYPIFTIKQKTNWRKNSQKMTQFLTAKRSAYPAILLRFNTPVINIERLLTVRRYCSFIVIVLPLNMFLESFWNGQRFLIITDFTLRKFEKKVSTFRDIKLPTQNTENQFRQKTDDQITTESRSSNQDRGRMIKSRQKADHPIKIENWWSNQDRRKMIKWRQKTDDQRKTHDQMKTEDGWSNQNRGRMIKSRQKTWSNQDRRLMIKSREKTNIQMNAEDRWSKQEGRQMIISR